MSCEEYIANRTQMFASIVQRNISRQVQTYLSLKYAIDDVALPITCTFGIVGNIINLLVLTRKQLQSTMDRLEKSAHFGLVALAVSDAMFCMLALINVLIPEQSQYTSVDVVFVLYFKVYEEPLLNIFLLSSTWLTVVMAVGRYLAICWPLHARGFISLRGTCVAIASAFLVSVLANLPLFWKYSILVHACPALSGPPGGTTHCQCYSQVLGPLMRNNSLRFAYNIAWATIGTFVPVVILAFCNVRLIQALHHSMKVQRQYRANRPHDSGHRLTPTIITIIILFLVLVCPSEVLKFTRAMTMGSHNFLLFQLATVITNFMQATNFAINFILYCVLNVHFRNMVKHVILCKWRHRWPNMKAMAVPTSSSPNHNNTMTCNMSETETEL